MGLNYAHDVIVPSVTMYEGSPGPLVREYPKIAKMYGWLQTEVSGVHISGTEEPGVQCQLSRFDRLHETVVGMVEVRVDNDLRIR